MGVVKMMNLEFYRNLPGKECRDADVKLKSNMNPIYMNVSTVCVHMKSR